MRRFAIVLAAGLSMALAAGCAGTIAGTPQARVSAPTSNQPPSGQQVPGSSPVAGPSGATDPAPTPIPPSNIFPTVTGIPTVSPTGPPPRSPVPPSTSAPGTPGTVTTSAGPAGHTTAPPTTSRPTVPSPPPGASTPPQSATVDGRSAPWNQGGYAQWQSPSGNIACLMGPLDQAGVVLASCDILHHTYPTPATPAGCPQEYGDRFEVSDSGKAILGCHGDTLFDPSAPTLPYGTSITWGRTACTSSQSGMWCGNLDTGHYFKVASAAYELG